MFINNTKEARVSMATTVTQTYQDVIAYLVILINNNPITSSQDRAVAQVVT
jgi:hypothetical protein